MATQTNRSYSEFFSSGLRAMSGTSYRRPFSSGHSSPIVPSTPPSALKSTGPYNVLRNLARRSRTFSSPLSSPLTPSEHTTTTSTRKQRRSSIINLPSRLLERMTQSIDARTLPDQTRDRSPKLDEEPRNSTGYEKNRPIVDPFDASPTSTSFFIDFDTPVSIPPPRSQRPQSFLLLGETARSPSYIRFPRRRERPSSVQSMPLPSRAHSRRSSYQYRPPSRDKYDRSWALEEEETPSPTWIEDVEERHDPAANIDWRQFHNDLLHEEQ
ncbi:hypothetical protein C8R43DRAFT_500895 [Mycena crocata]|nr:hypothetical protein C8R43DRAFT_500895 [Mycena crocata]